MFRRIFATALGAGIGVGLLLAALQHVALVPMILDAEKYERKEATREQAVIAGDRRHVGQSAAAALPAPHAVGRAHAHGHDAVTASGERLWRAGWTTIATTLTSVGFALLLVGAFAVSGREVSAREGVLWGLAAFASFSLAPAFGLPPELPGAAAGDLQARQLWWLGAVVMTALGLVLIVFGRVWWAVAVGVVVIAVPQLVGAPHAAGGIGSAPPELAAAFAARTLVVGAIFWSVLGWAAGALYARLGRVEAA